MKQLLHAMLGHLHRHGGALALSGASQMLNSLTNFAIVLYLVRVLSKDDFGLYSLGFAAYLVIAAIIAAVFAVQYVVNNPDQPEQDRSAYAMHHVVAVAMVATLVILVAAFLKIAISTLATEPGSGLFHELLELALPVSVAVAGFATRDMLLRVAFVGRKEWVVFGSAVSAAAILGLAFFLANILSVPPSAPLALVFVALGQFAGALLVLAMLGLPWRRLSLPGMRHTFADAWRGGRWHAMTSIVYSIRTQAHQFVILPIVGLTALAEINAARILVTPAVMVIPPLYQVVMPRLADMRGSDPNHMQRATLLTVGGLVSVAFVYSAILLFALGWVLPLSLGHDYAHLGPVVTAWCVFTMFLAARNGLTMGLEVSKAFRALLTVNSVAALVAVALAAGLAILWGGLGAVWGLALAELTLCVLLYRRYRIGSDDVAQAVPVITVCDNKLDVELSPRYMKRVE